MGKDNQKENLGKGRDNYENKERDRKVVKKNNRPETKNCGSVESLKALTGQTRQFKQCSNSRVGATVGQVLFDKSNSQIVGQIFPINSWLVL
jgi:hypothetical protein